MARRFRRTVTVLVAVAAVVTLAGGAAHAATASPARHGGCAANSAARGTVYVVNWTGGVTPIPVCTNTPGKPIPVGDGPVAIAITPNGRTAYPLAAGATITVRSRRGRAQRHQREEIFLP